MSPALIPTLLTLAMGAEAGNLELEASAAGGYESNLLLAAAGQPSIDSAVYAASIGAGRSGSLSERTKIYVGARYQGAMYSDAADLTRNGVGASLLLSHVLVDGLAALLIPDVSYAWYGNASRNGPTYVGKVLLRMTASRLTLRAGYGRVEQQATDVAYSISANRFLASADVLAGPGTFLFIAYSVQAGTQVFYRSSTPGFGGMGSGAGDLSHGGSGMFAGLTPFRANATQNALSPGFERRLWKDLYLNGKYEYTWGSRASERFTAHSLYAGATYRL